MLTLMQFCILYYCILFLIHKQGFNWRLLSSGMWETMYSDSYLPASVHKSLLFYTKNENSRFLWNVGKYLPDYMVSHSKEQYQTKLDILHIQHSHGSVYKDYGLFWCETMYSSTYLPTLG
jgi:hypothetical protein